MDKLLEIKLSSFLSFEIPKEMIDHILSLNTENSVREYFDTLLDKSDPKQRQFINEFINKRNLKTSTSKRKDNRNKKNNKPAVNNEGLVEVKSDFNELEKQYQVSTKKDKDSKQNKKENLEKDIEKSGICNENVLEKYETPYQKYKKVTFTPFDFNRQSYPLLPGRRFCGCFAKRHKLINNCVKCGRLQCEQEGSGPCMFCGSLVVSRKEREILDSGTKEADILISRLLDQPKPDGWEKAVEKQKKLRDADIARKELQKIIDDQSDYFTLTTSTWNAATGNKDEISDVAKQMNDNAERETSLKSQTVTKVGAINKKFFEKNKQINNQNSNTVQNANNTEIGIKYDDKWRIATAREFGLVCPVATIDKELEQFLATLPEMKMPELRERLFYQDPRTLMYNQFKKDNDDIKYDWQNEFWELNDYFDRLGFCLSVRQPYASLIMSGIKMHEGRDWKMDLRGIFWIASAAYEPTKEEIETVEKFYRKKYEGKNLNFPKKYPTGRLLGRVQVVTCLSREEYFEQYPDGEVDNDWVFILKDIIPLPILFPMKGHSGIYLLPKKLHTAAGLLIKRLIRDKPELVEE